MIELFIAKSVFGGEGLAHHEGKVCFVEGALPGERVLADIFEQKKNFSRARILEILEPSPGRINPPCRYAAHCGGCQYQHVEYKTELGLKEAQLAEILKAIPEITADKINPIVASPLEYGYRNSVTLHAIFAKKSKGAALGFIAKDNVSKIPIQECLLVDPRLSGIFGKEYSLKKGTEKAAFKLSESGDIVTDAGETFFRVGMGGESFLASSQGFFQNNLKIASLLAEKIRTWVEKAKPRVFFDLYAGVGTFSFLCAKSAEKIIAIEEGRVSVEAMRMNSQEKKIPMQIVEGRVEKIFPAVWEKERNDASLVLLDPPRQGVSPDLAKFLAKSEGIGSLIYVSCDPVTLARDLKTILSLGQWQVQEVAPFDMFPRTKHIEVAVFLCKSYR